MRGNQIQEAGDRWLQQRAEYRRENRARVRARERLPFHDGEKYVIGDKRVGLAIGAEKGAGAGQGIAAGFDVAARQSSEFVMEVRDPAALDRELADLVRDAQNLARREMVIFEGVPTGPHMDGHVLEDDTALDDWLQSELKYRMER